MPRSYRGAHLVRRIRRRLEQNGYPAQVRIIEKPAWHPHTTPFLIETRIEDNGTYVLHHPAVIPTQTDKVDAIITRTMETRGVPEDAIQKRLDQCGHSLSKDEGYLALDRWSCDPIIIVPTIMLDVLRRRWDTFMSFPHPIGNSLPGDLALPESMHQHIEADRKRRLRDGSPKPLRIGGLFSEILRHREDGADILMRVVPFLERALDETVDTGDGSVITVEKVMSGIPNLGMRWSIKGNRVHLKDYDRPQWSITGDTLLLKQDMPQAIVESLRGRRLGDLVEGLPLDPNLTITRAVRRRSPWSGVSLGLMAQATSPKELAAQLKRKVQASIPDKDKDAMNDMKERKKA